MTGYEVAAVQDYSKLSFSSQASRVDDKCSNEAG